MAVVEEPGIAGDAETVEVEGTVDFEVVVFSPWIHRSKDMPQQCGLQDGRTEVE